MGILVIGSRAPAEYAALRRELEGEHEVVVAESVGASRACLSERRWSLVVLDTGGGADLADLLPAAGGSPVLVVLAHPTLQATLDALEAGARDVHAPPLRAERLRDLASRDLVAEAPASGSAPASGLIVGECAAMLDVY